MSLQTIIFDKRYYTKQMALSWLRGHGFKSSKIDNKAHTYHFRQRQPRPGGRYYSKYIAHGILFVFEK